MGSIRSLATITILAVVAGFLYVKINEAPKPAGGQQVETAPGVPPLTGLTTPDAPPTAFSATESGAAPAWSAPPAAPGATATGGDVSGGTTPPSPSTELPPMPAIPDMPDLPALDSPPNPAPSATSAPAPPTALPANIPTAQYAESPPLPPEGISGRVPSLGTATPNLASTQAPPAGALPSAPGAPPAVPSSPEAGSGLTAVDSAMLPGTSPPAAAPPPVVTPPPTAVAPPAAAQATSDDNRYGEDTAYGSGPTNPVTTSAAPTNATDMVGVSSFAEGWPAIQAALERGELARAHLLLSQWYEDPSLTPAESQQVDMLLGQLAGSVVYSTEHQLEPAYVVQPGESLESIAQKYDVPWQLLAKINGIPAANQVRPGQTLKVVHGPFSAVVEAGRQQLTLMLDGRYAGKFSISVPPEVSLPEGQWVVAAKPATPAAAPSSYGVPGSSTPTSAALRHLLLKSADGNPGAGAALAIGSNPSVGMDYHQLGAAGEPTGGAVPYLKVSPGDANELADILSVGSRVEIRR